jgi:hypothetical protein
MPDWAIIVAYIALALAAGVWFSKRTSPGIWRFAAGATSMRDGSGAGEGEDPDAA